jgi:hypothetical protein
MILSTHATASSAGHGCLMRQLILVVCVSAALAAENRAQELNVTFAEWVGFPQAPRAAYLAGILDHVYYLEDETALQWGKCLAGAKRTLAQIADELAAYAEKSPVTYINVPDALQDYVLHLCPDVR